MHHYKICYHYNFIGEFQQLSHFPNNYVVPDIAWIVLNLRSASLGIMFTLSSIYRQVSKKNLVKILYKIQLHEENVLCR